MFNFLRALTCFPIFFNGLFIYSLKSSTFFMRLDFLSETVFSGLLGDQGLAMVEELGSDSIKLHWFLSLMLGHLPFYIWLSLL